VRPKDELEELVFTLIPPVQEGIRKGKSQQAKFIKAETGKSQSGKGKEALRFSKTDS